MSPVALFVVLVALPPVLMVVSHLYAVQHQDRKARYVVVLDPRVRSSRRVAEDHARQYRVHVENVWDASIKGYSALIPKKKLRRLREDRRVQSVERREIDEFLKPR